MESKQETIINVSSLFNRGLSAPSQTAFFENKKHDDTVSDLQSYLAKNTFLIGAAKITTTQSLNDHGVDLIAEFPNGTKIGFQIKSHVDVQQKDFAMKVKAQLSDSKFHALDKWYLLICSPLKDSETDYTSKIQHLINEFSGYKSNYHAVYNPQQCANILTLPNIAPAEFNNIKNQFTFTEIDWPQILTELKEAKGNKNTTLGYLSRLETHDENEIMSCKEFCAFMGVTDPGGSEYVLEDLNDLRNKLIKIPRQTREFLTAVLSRAKKERRLTRYVLPQEIENALHLTKEGVEREVKILEDYGLASYDDLEPSEWYIAINKINHDYNTLGQIRDFCLKSNKSLEDVIVNLNFKKLD